jgi:hypothetical protein
MSLHSTLRLHSASEVPACVRSLRWHRLPSLTLLIAFLPSCVSWHEQGPTPEAAIRNLAPSTVRITRADRSKLTLRSPAVAEDSIVGQPVPAARSAATPRVAVPLGEVPAWLPPALRPSWSAWQQTAPTSFTKTPPNGYARPCTKGG